MRTAGLAMGLGLAVALSARQDPAPVFRTGVDLIQLDVAVLDRARRPVLNLSAEDFVVEVDGLTRPVVAFKAVHLPPPELRPAAPWVRDVAPDVASNLHPSGRALVIVIDDRTVPTTASLAATWWMAKTRETAHRVVEELGPDDLAAVVFTENNHTAQGFTNDRARLLAAIDRAAIFPAMPLVGNTGAGGAKTAGADQNGSCPCGDCSPRTLASVADALRSLPQQRKTVVYISSGVAILPDITESCNALRLEAQQDALHKAALANVTIQSLDPKGLTVGADNPAQDYLRVMAESTGGRAVLNDNDVETKVPDVLAESRAYYLLGVEPVGPAANGRFHPVRIRVNRPGLEVRTRSGYYDATSKERQRMATRIPSRGVDAAIEGVMPKGDVPLEVAVAPFRGDRDATLAIVLGLTAPPANEIDTARRSESVDVLASLFNPETGKGMGSRRLSLAIDRTQASPRSEYREVLVRLPAKRGRYEVRLGVQMADGRTASVYTFAEVPNFAGDALSLSGLLLSASPAASAAARAALSDLVPVVPTARRHFQPADIVTGFLRVYQKSWNAAADLTMRITDETGAVVITRTARLPAPSSRATNGADHAFDVPVADLSAGEYLLSVDVDAGKRQARRVLRFSVE